MNKDTVEGKAKDIAGRVERKAGEWARDEETKVKGAAKEVEGKVQNAVGNMKDRLKKENGHDHSEEHGEETEDVA